MCSDCGREGCDGSCSYSSNYGQTPTQAEQDYWNRSSDDDDDRDGDDDDDTDGDDDDTVDEG